MKIKKAIRKLRRQGRQRAKNVPSFDVEATIKAARARGASRRRGTGA